MSSDTPIQTGSIYPTEPIHGTGNSAHLPSGSSITQVNKGDSLDEVKDDFFNPFAMRNQFTSIRRKREKERDDREGSTEMEEGEKIQDIEEIAGAAERYSRKSHQELQKPTLLAIRDRIQKSDTPEEIIRKVLETYPDHSLADDVLDFLIETSNAEISLRAQEAKEQFNRDFGREIIAGRNISDRAREFSLQGLGSPTALRDIYRDVTGNPRDPNTLFEQLSETFPYEKMKTVIDFMLHALGADLKAKGPSILRAELHRLMTETRVLQAILQVYRFFRLRMRLINKAFAKRGISLPARITFEVLAKLFMKYIQERYPSVDKAMQLMIALMGDDLPGQVIAINQFLYATQQVAPILFRDNKQRLDIRRSFLEALEQIEEEEEEDTDEKEKEGKPKKKKKPPEERV
jgi:type III secretion protein W